MNWKLLLFTGFYLSFIFLTGCSNGNNQRSGEPRVLVFTKTEGFRHASIPDGVRAIQKLGMEEGFIVGRYDIDWYGIMNVMVVEHFIRLWGHTSESYENLYVIKILSAEIHYTIDKNEFLTYENITALRVPDENLFFKEVLGGRLNEPTELTV